MGSQQVLVVLGIATAILALWAAIFATRADLATHRAKSEARKRWDDSIRPLPHVTFTSAPAVGLSIEITVQNLHPALAAVTVLLHPLVTLVPLLPPHPHT